LALDPLLSKLFERHVIKQIVEALYTRAQIAPAFGVEPANQIHSVFLIALIATQDQFKDFDSQVLISFHRAFSPFVKIARRSATLPEQIGQIDAAP
jgi:hypothetical protein